MFAPFYQIIGVLGAGHCSVSVMTCRVHLKRETRSRNVDAGDGSASRVLVSLSGQV